MNKVTNFVKQVLAQLAGDTDGVIAAQNERKANSHLKSQIAVLEGKLVEQEEELKDAQDRLTSAKFPAFKIDSGAAYLEGILDAQEEVDDAQETLDQTNQSIAYWKKLLAEYNEQVDAEENS